MKVKKLIKQLRKVSGDNNVYLISESVYFDFSGIGFDDNNDVELFVAAGDKPA